MFLYALERRKTIQQPNYYSILPASVRYCKEITGDEKLLFSELTCLANKLGYCYASNKYFANLYEVSTRTITRRLAKLQQYGFIKIIIDRNDKNEVICRRIYLADLPKITESVDKSVHTPIDNNVYTPIDRNVLTPMDGSVQYNNTSNINNTRLNTTRENRDNNISVALYNILESYNNICTSLSPYPKIRNDDKRNIHNILNKGIDYIDLFERVEQSDFLSGRSGKWKGCTFNWIIQPNNIEKIMNGSYDNHSTASKKSTNKFFEIAMNMDGDE